MKNRYEVVEALRESGMSDTTILNEIVTAMSEWDAVEADGEGYLMFGARMNDVGIEGE